MTEQDRKFINDLVKLILSYHNNVDLANRQAFNILNAIKRDINAKNTKEIHNR